MKLLKGICMAIIAACLVCLVATPFICEAETITFTEALAVITIIVLVVLAALGTYLAATDDIKTTPNGGNR